MSHPVRFVHAADLHLGAPFLGVDASDETLRDGRVRDALVSSTHEALRRIVDVCLAEKVDFLVIAGDVYNAAEKSVRDQASFRAQMRRLADAGIHAYIAHGNHDPADGWSAGLALPELVHVFRHDAVERIEHVRDGEVVAAVYGRSFPTKKVTADYAAGFHRGIDDPVAVGVLHTNVGSRPGYDDYAPTKTEVLARANMDYWALGHIHVPGRVLDSPRAVYAGCPQGLTPNEDGERGCWLVEIGPRGAEERFVETASVRWARAEVDAAAAEDLDGLLGVLAAACERLREDAGERPVVARLRIGGSSPVHAELVRPGVLKSLVSTLRMEQLERDPWLWVDEVRDDTRRVVDAEASRAHDGFDGELVRLADERKGEAAQRELAELLDPVLARLVVKMDTGLDADAVVERARDACLDLLVPEGER